MSQPKSYFKVFAKFESSTDEHKELVLGGYNWLQITYNQLRGSKNESDNGELEIAGQNLDQTWDARPDGDPAQRRYSDIIIGVEVPPNTTVKGEFDKAKSLFDDLSSATYHGMVFREVLTNNAEARLAAEVLIKHLRDRFSF